MGSIDFELRCSFCGNEMETKEASYENGRVEIYAYCPSCKKTMDERFNEITEMNLKNCFNCIHCETYHEDEDHGLGMIEQRTIYYCKGLEIQLFEDQLCDCCDCYEGQQKKDAKK